MGELAELQKIVAEFRDCRDWRQFHTIKNLAQALSSEVGELNDLLLWDRTPDLSLVAEEMADILIYLLSLADVAGINLAKAVIEKIKVNERRYPVNNFKGNDGKYISKIDLTPWPKEGE